MRTELKTAKHFLKACIDRDIDKAYKLSQVSWTERWKKEKLKEIIDLFIETTGAKGVKKFTVIPLSKYSCDVLFVVVGESYWRFDAKLRMIMDDGIESQLPKRVWGANPHSLRLTKKMNEKTNDEQKNKSDK